jgi:hypothetical protein
MPARYVPICSIGFEERCRSGWVIGVRAVPTMFGDRDRGLCALDDCAAEYEDEDRGAGADDDEGCHEERRS